MNFQEKLRPIFRAVFPLVATAGRQLLSVHDDCDRPTDRGHDFDLLYVHSISSFCFRSSMKIPATANAPKLPVESEENQQEQQKVLQYRLGQDAFWQKGLRIASAQIVP